MLISSHFFILRRRKIHILWRKWDWLSGKKLSPRIWKREEEMKDFLWVSSLLPSVFRLRRESTCEIFYLYNRTQTISQYLLYIAAKKSFYSILTSYHNISFQKIHIYKQLQLLENLDKKPPAKLSRAQTMTHYKYQSHTGGLHGTNFLFSWYWYI